jgi:hypothetical protein
MELLVLLACAVMAAIVIVADARAMRDDHRLARVATPVGAGLALAAGIADRWPPTAWLLAVALLATPAILAYRVRTPAAWNAVLVFALAGAIAGYGLLDVLLARAVHDNASPSGLAVAAAIAGGAVGVAAYAWLYVQALVRR